MYAHNLRRSWRKSAAAARADATYTSEVLLLSPLVLLCCLAYLVLIKRPPHSVAMIDATASKVAGVASLAACWYWLDAQISSVVDLLEVLAKYAGGSEQRKTMYLFALNRACILLVALASRTIQGN
jgi:hypothetical protein